MAEPYIGELRVFSFNFAPKGWAMCNGQTMSIQQNTALFALLGTFYGGNGVSTFQLPNLQGNVPTHLGVSPSGTQYTIGEVAGTPNVTVINSQMPQHTHNLNANTAGTGMNPGGSFPAAQAGTTNYTPASDGSILTPTAVPLQGGNLPHNNMQPYLVLNICIALQGIFPSRN